MQVKERTVRPLRVTGLGTRTARIASGDELSPFTGRDRELAELQRALEVAADGEGQVVGVAGDPGLGKSRLALEFCRLAEPYATVLEGRCLSYGASIAYLPLFELVRNACGIAADDSPNLAGTKIELKIKALELDVSLAHYLRHAFGLPAGDPGLAALDPRTIRARTFDALSQLLVAEAGRRPMVVLLEDLHWIDQTSQEFLAGFVDELPSVPIMLLVTYRVRLLPAVDRQVIHLPAGAASAVTGGQRKDRGLDACWRRSGLRRRRSPSAEKATRSSSRNWPGPAGTRSPMRQVPPCRRRSSRCWPRGSTG